MKFTSLFRHLVAIGCIAAIAATTACSQNGGADGGIRKQDLGTLIGGAGGAAVGSQFGNGNGRVAMIAAGTLLGAFAGNEVGSSLDRADMAYAQKSSQAALESNKIGVASQWHNPDSGNSGTITPTRTYKSDEGAYCREFTQTVEVGGKKQDAYGKACRQPDGAWKIVQ